MSRSHGVAGEFGEEAWTAPARTPVYYPDAVTLAPGADPAAVTARIDTAAPGASVKDSFADLDLTDAGFQVLFEARWIHRPAGAPALAPTPAWGVVDDAKALRSWAEAWGDTRHFRPELLDDAATFVLAGRDPGGRVVAGAVASVSGDDGRQVVGVSNVFATDGGPDSAWPGVLDVAHRLFPGLPVVGYEQGDDLAVALRHGFETIGPLRVWVQG
ncbi:hypothetical protein ACOKM3_39580 [Streptomyces sp. BH106]|uniref:hypothetical protein n=1 Tax=Streptomyces sp. BH106 TaxID=3410409 RepID=UPI003CEB7FF7